MFANVTTIDNNGIEGYAVDVEVYLSPGLPRFYTVGLADTSVKESKDRVIAAIRNSGYDFPPRKVTVNLAPADIRKEGGAFDLPIAVGILAADEVIKKEHLGNYAFLGELSLDGTLRPVRAVLPKTISLLKSRVKKLILPEANKHEASVVKGITVIPVSNLCQTVDYLNGEVEIPACKIASENSAKNNHKLTPDLSEIKGQFFAKRALEIAAAGGHNIIMIGPPGSGKTMLAGCLPGILPRLTFEEAIGTTMIHSLAGLIGPGESLLVHRPFRNPHHTISNAAVIGGGDYPKPGEISLAHNGVLFLDELPEFHRDVLEALRQPLESRRVVISRARGSMKFPASFMLVAAMNPCPCGYYGHPVRECQCNPYKINKYISKISGPLLDRIDIHVEVPALKDTELMEDTTTGESSDSVRERVHVVCEIQEKRFAEANIKCNAQMGNPLIRQYCKLDGTTKAIMRTAVNQLGLSARAYNRILKVARTIADMDMSPEIEEPHIAEAVQYRVLDKPYTALI